MSIHRPASLARLINMFARIYPDQALSRMVVQRAEMDETMIAFDARAAVNWTEIINYALRNNAIDALIAASADEELHPELAPDMKAELAEYRKWAAAQPAEKVEEVAAAPPAGFFENTRKTILSWSSIAVGVFAITGALARESMHVYLGLPGSHANDFFSEPAGYASEGWGFVRDLVTLTADYASLNPLAVIAAIALAVVIVQLGRREARTRRRIAVPAVVVPLLLAGALAKTLWYDAPVAWYANVVTRDYSPKSLAVPRIFTTPARARWTSIVCSRIGGRESAAVVCGNSDRIAHRQNIEGMYLLDAGFTFILCGIGIFALRKLLLPSRYRAWNLSRRRKWRAAIGVAAAMAIALVPLPSTYSRTVRPTTYPYICPPVGGKCYFRICVDDQCHRYAPGDPRFTGTGAVPEGARERSEDILTKAFESRETENVIAPL